MINLKKQAWRTWALCLAGVVVLSVTGVSVYAKTSEKKEPLKIYADNKESFFQVKYMSISQPGKDGVTMEKKGYVIMLRI